MSSLNNTMVGSSLGPTAGSHGSHLSQLVHVAVCQNPHLKLRRVSTVTHRGCVTLQGTVASFFEKQMAQEGLRNIQGVTRIENQIEVAAQESVEQHAV